MTSLTPARSQRLSPISSVMLLLSALAVLLSPPLMGLAYAGKTQRAAKCATKGDARVSKSISTKVVMHAIKKYQIEDLVDKAGIKAARKEVYEFLKWKLGNPTAICAQYVTAGTKHFKKAYADEAAAALLGYTLPGKGGAEVQLPKELADVLKKSYEQAGDGFAKTLQDEYGIPPEATAIVVDAVRKYANKATDNLGFNVPKGWDFDNKLLDVQIRLKRKA